MASGNSFWWGNRFPSGHPSRLTLFICTFWMTLISDAWMTRLVWPTLPPLYPQNLRFQSYDCLKQCYVYNVYNCYNISLHFTSLTSFPVHFSPQQVTKFTAVQQFTSTVGNQQSTVFFHGINRYNRNLV